MAIKLIEALKTERASLDGVDVKDVNPTKDLHVTLVTFIKDLMTDPATTEQQRHKLARLRAFIDINFKKSF